MGPRSVLLLEGAEHLSRRQGDAAALPRRPHARLRADRPRGGRARDRALADGPAVRGAPQHAGGHPRGDPARRLRRRRRRAPRAPARAAGRAAGVHGSVGLQFSVLLSRRLGGPDPLAQPRGAHGRDRRDPARRDRRAPGRGGHDGGARRHLLAAGRGALRRRRPDGGSRGPRPADHAAARRPRDHGDRAGVDARPAHPPPRRARAPARRARRRAATPTCAR